MHTLMHGTGRRHVACSDISKNVKTSPTGNTTELAANGHVEMSNDTADTNKLDGKANKIE